MSSLGTIFDSVGAAWVVGGSVAGSLLGEPRTTNDVDIAVSMTVDSIPIFVDAVTERYYAPLEMITDAARENGAANLICLTTGFKIDLFFLGSEQLDQWQIARRMAVEIPGTGRIWVTSAPDVILRKLWWFRLGNETSERQWNDVVSVIRVQRSALDTQQLVADAAMVDLEDLATRALRSANE